MNRKQIVLAISLFILASFVAGTGMTYYLNAKGQSNSENNTIQQLGKFSRVFSIVKSNYVFEENSDSLITSAIRGMLRSLDPHSIYMDKNLYNELMIMTRGKFGGIGIQIGTSDGYPVVIAPMEGTPAYKLGIIAGDKIVKIEGKNTHNKSLGTIVSKLRGIPGTKVHITIQRVGIKEPIKYTIVRDYIKVKSVPYATTLDSHYVYIRLTDFSQTASPEVGKALDSLVNSSTKGIILDLRFNPGGLITEAQRVAGYFLPRNSTVVSTRGRMDGIDKVYRTINFKTYTDIPMTVLVDRGSASASEIVSGAIQDWDRGLIIGDTTYGKGSVQTVFPLGPKEALKLTTARYFTPSGRCIDKELRGDTIVDTFRTIGGLSRLITSAGGVIPDVEVPYRKISNTEIRLAKDNIYFKFSASYCVGKKDRLKDIYKMNDNVWSAFKSYVAKEDTSISMKELNKNKTNIEGTLNSYISRILWGEPGWYQATFKTDLQLKKALRILKKTKNAKDIIKEIAGN
ncbi:MAG: PDZ domain-containing protein [Proteobacteria bacterium]|nr:PDZ domain-containing protein [Pseudomonadota bacterium]